MDAHLFESFSKMIDCIPAKGVVEAVETQCRMIEDDFAHKRSMPLKTAASILAFGRFLNAAARGENFSSSDVPIHHVPTYRRTVERLVDAGELPVTAQEQFNNAFSGGFLHSLP